MRILIWMIIPILSHAFPEMVRHGYFNCVACHVNPSGGGVLSEYGRALSKELLSTWSFDGEEKFAYGLIPESENLRLGGNIRSVQIYQDDPNVKFGDWFLMQADLELAFFYKNFVISGTLGSQQGPRSTSKRDQFISRRHFVGYKINDEWMLRWGRLLTPFGWNQANHTLVTERHLGFDQGNETYNTELSYSGEKWNLFLTHMSGRPDDSKVDGERGATLSASLALSDKSALGLSALTGKTNQGNTRQLFGLFGVQPILENIYILAEVDHQWRQPHSSGEQKGVVGLVRLNFEANKGIHLYAIHQIRYLDYLSPANRMDKYGLGFQFFPRPHMEIQAEFYKQKDLSRFETFYDIANVMFNYYL